MLLDYELSERIKSAESVLLEVPGIVKPLKPFQQKGVSWLYSVKKGILADDVGLGKTVQAVALAALIKSKGTLGNVFIGCLGGHERHWLRIIKEFAPDVFESVSIVSGSFKNRRRTRNERASLYNESPRIMISNYHILRNDIDLIEGYGFGLVILDEATAFKNHDTKLFAAVRRLCADVPRVVALTATPFEKALVELHAVQEALHLGLFGSVSQFRDSFEIVKWIEKRVNGRIIYLPKHLQYQNIEQFKAIIRPVSLRREEKEVEVELPEVRSRNIVLEMAESQKRFYMELAKDFKRGGSLGTFTRLTQCCDAPSVTGMTDDDTSPKLEEVMRSLENEFDGYKMVIFARWHNTVDLITKRLTREGISWVPFTGKQEPDVRNRNKDMFIEDPDIQVLVTTTAGEKGVDGLQIARGLIAFNQLYNPQRMRQVVGRLRRMGSPHKSIIYHNLLMEATVEEKLWELLMSRAELFDAVFDSEETVNLFKDSSVQSMKAKALKELLDTIESID